MKTPDADWRREHCPMALTVKESFLRQVRVETLAYGEGRCSRSIARELKVSHGTAVAIAIGIGINKPRSPKGMVNYTKDETARIREWAEQNADILPEVSRTVVRKAHKGAENGAKIVTARQAG